MTSLAQIVVLAFAFLRNLFLPSNTQTALVSHVYDGDTIQISTGEKIHLIGIDTPEVNDTEECFGSEAAQKTRKLLLNRTVRLEKDVSEADKYGRLLRYVWKDSELVNATLVTEGFAKVETVPPDLKYQEQLTSAVKTARENNAGLWSKCAN